MKRIGSPTTIAERLPNFDYRGAADDLLRNNYQRYTSLIGTLHINIEYFGPDTEDGRKCEYILEEYQNRVRAIKQEMLMRAHVQKSVEGTKYEFIPQGNSVHLPTATATTTVAHIVDAM